jgi:hypothetical protein
MAMKSKGVYIAVTAAVVLVTRRRADAEGNRENLLWMVALKERLPELIIVPAHDIGAFAEIPRLPKPSSMTRSSQ